MIIKKRQIKELLILCNRKERGNREKFAAAATFPIDRPATFSQTAVVELFRGVAR